MSGFSTCVSDNDVFEEISVRHGQAAVSGLFSALKWLPKKNNKSEYKALESFNSPAARLGQAERSH
ncbi:hypothetical protein PDJAM_G00059510 [Pangasius djambal]|uniref:Uncharacterized protein n=1 Tax=Pangasius djambal TaxID=1691987 RepID=A0ACC5YXJ9_9TELE|nr:hypothetical protein [Pangasius djambal]